MSGYRREMLPTGVSQDERFSGKCGPHIQGRGAANQSHVCTGNAGSGGEFVEGEDGVLAKIDGRGVFKLNLGAAFAGDETESRRNWNAGCGLSPVAASGALTLFAARDANVAFDETEAHDLVVGWRRSGAGRRLRVWRGVRIGGGGVGSKRDGQEKNCETTAGRDAHGSPPLEQRRRRFAELLRTSNQQLLPIDDATARLKTSRGFIPLVQFDAFRAHSRYLRFHKNC